MEVEEGSSEPSLPFAYLGPNHPTLYFPDTARPALLFHRSLLRPHAVILSKTTKEAGASLGLEVNEEQCRNSATVVEEVLDGKSPTCEMDQTHQPVATHTEKPMDCLDERAALKKRNFVESSSQTEWHLPPKEQFVPVRKGELGGTASAVIRAETSPHVENDQSGISVAGSAQESVENLKSDMQDKIEALSAEVKDLDNNEHAKAKVSGPASPLFETRNDGGEFVGERFEEEAAKSGEKLDLPGHASQESNAIVSDKEESILPDIDNADVVMGILGEDIEHSNNIEDVLKQPITNNDILADLIAELNNGLCDENKNAKEVENAKFPADGSGRVGSDQLLQNGRAQQEAEVGISLSNQAVDSLRDGLGNSTSSNPTLSPKPLIARPNGIRVPFPFPSRGVATDRIAISPMACLPLTAFRPSIRSNKAGPQVSLPSTVPNYPHQHLLSVNRPLPLRDLQMTPGSLALPHPTLPLKTPKPLYLQGGFDSKAPHVSSSGSNQGGLADTNLNAITISSDEEDSQVPGNLQEVGLDKQAHQNTFQTICSEYLTILMILSEFFEAPIAFHFWLNL